MLDFYQEELKKIRTSVDTLIQDPHYYEIIRTLATLCKQILEDNGKIMFAGNGGSAADAQHLAAELVSRLRFNRPGLSAVALTTDTSALTAIGNDYGFDQLFSRQVEAIGKKGDILIAISTSGNSENILSALSAAKKMKITTIGFSGKHGGKMAALCDHTLFVPATETPKIQECHIMLGHILCAIIEAEMFSLDKKGQEACVR